MSLPLALARWRDEKRWCLWREETRNGKRTKVPYQRVPNERAKSNDASTWSTYAELEPRMSTAKGVGIFLGNGLGGVDLDACKKDGRIEPWAAEIIDLLDTYTEESPSGHGLHCLFLANPGHSAVAHFGDEIDFGGGYTKRPSIEFYRERRYFTVSARVTRDKDIAIVSDKKIDRLLEIIEARKRVEVGTKVPTPMAKVLVADSATSTTHHSGEWDAVRVRAALQCVGDVDAYRSWLDIGMALHEGSGGSAEGLSLWLDWSRRSQSFNEPECEKKWRSFKPGGGIGLGTLFQRARDGGWREEHGGHDERRAQQRKEAQDIGDGLTELPTVDVMECETMLETCVYVSEGSRVALRDYPQLALPFSEFTRHTGASRTAVGDGKKTRLAPTAELWLRDPSRVTVHTLTFRPGHPEFTKNPDGIPALNLWKPRIRPGEGRVSDEDVVDFLGHVEYLVPIEQEREFFLNWLAHIEQFPGQLPHSHYLMVTPQTGIGRNWLAALLARVWSGATRVGFDLYRAINSGFNGGLSRRLLVIVDELKAADDGYGAEQQGQALKSLLTAAEREINPKYGRAQQEFNVARFLMLSQHHDALPLENADRRVIVIENPTERRPAEYYSALYQRLDDPAFINNVGRWLGQRDLSGFNPNEPAPRTEAKLRAIQASKSDAVQALEALRDHQDAALTTAGEIKRYLDGSGIRLHGGRSTNAAYTAVGFAALGLIRLADGNRVRVVAMRDVEHWRQQPPEVLRAELRRE